MASRPQLTKLGELEVLESPAMGDSQGLVFCMHGYGADCHDLYDLVGYLDSKRNFDWIFPNGPLKVPIGPHMYGRGWFSIDIMGLQLAIQEGRVHEMQEYVPPEMKASVSKVRQILEMKKRKWSETVVMGFSQGAMMAVDLALAASENPRAAVLLSASMIQKPIWTERFKVRAGLKYFQSHGTHDPVLSVEGARTLNEELNKAGWLGQLIEFPGGHEIPMDVLVDLQSFFRDLSR